MTLLVATTRAGTIEFVSVIEGVRLMAGARRAFVVTLGVLALLWAVALVLLPQSFTFFNVFWLANLVAFLAFALTAAAGAVAMVRDPRCRLPAGIGLVAGAVVLAVLLGGFLTVGVR